MEFDVTFSGNQRVDAHIGNMTIHTDQPVAEGGDNTAPAPFLLFLASIGTCAGYYVMQFCRTRDISTDGIKIVQKVDRDRATGVLRKIDLEIHVPPSFPEKYLKAVIKAADHCAVKHTIQNPPAFETTVKVG